MSLKRICTRPGNRLLQILFLILNFLAIRIHAESNIKKCFACDLEVPSIMQTPGAEDPCEDLMLGACYQADMSYRSEGLFDKISKRLESAVDEAKRQAVQAAGFKNLEEFYIDRFNKSGLRIKKQLSSEAKLYLQKGNYKDWVEPTQIYEVPSQCAIESKSLGEIRTDNLQTMKALEEYEKRIEAFSKKHLSALEEGFAADLPRFLSHLNNQCSTLEKKRTEIEKAGNLHKPEVASFSAFCRQKGAFRNQVVNFYVLQDTPENFQKKLEFVRKYFHFVNISVLDWTESAGDSNSEDPLSARQSELNKKYAKAASLCSKLNEKFQQMPERVREEVQLQLSRSRPAVEYLVERFFSPKRHELAMKMFSFVKKEAPQYTKRLTQDSEKRELIQSFYDRMKLNWLQKPAPASYEKNPKSGLEVLRFNPFDQVNLWRVVTAPDFSFWLSMNAFFLPDRKIGNFNNDISVTMQPIFLELMDQNPYAFFMVLAHEVGHNLGPEVSVMNGYDLHEEYGSLLQCFSSSDSIRMQRHQKDEVIADYFAHEMVYELIEQLPQSHQQSAVYASLQPLCVMSENFDKDGEFNTDVPHPDPVLRVSRLFGASVKFRKLLRCQKEARKFRTCDLKGGPN